MGYTPAFSDIYTGTLYGRWPAAAVWASLLPLLDKNGVIDMSMQAISGMTGWPLELLSQGINQLSEPDPHSRTPDHEGRRLVPIDPNRPWGWRAVNHAKYRERARKQNYDQARTESGADAERKRQQRSTGTDVPTRPDASRALPLSDTNTDSNKEKRESAHALAPPKPRPSKRCPQEFQVTADLMAWAASKYPGMDIETETAMFRDHEFKTAYSDWACVWRNWIRREAKNGVQHGNSRTGSKPRLSAVERVYAATQRQIDDASRDGEGGARVALDG